MVNLDENKFKKYENICYKLILLGALLMAAGLGLSAVGSGLSVIAIYGGFVIFVFTVLLVLLYLAKDLKSE